jgi:ankyrin repeat protein
LFVHRYLAGIMKNIPPTRPTIHSIEQSSSEEFSSFSEEFSSFSESKQDPKLELVVIYGPRQLPTEAAFLHFMAKQSGLTHAMEGLNNKKINESKIKNIITDRLQNYANVFLMGHGDFKNNQHTLEFFGSKPTPTKDLIEFTYKKLNISEQNNNSSKPIIHVVSCESGNLMNEIRPGSHAWQKGYVILYSSKDSINFESTSNSIEAVMRYLQECKKNNRSAEPLEIFLHAARSQGSQITILGGDLRAPITSNFPTTPSEQKNREFLSYLEGHDDDISRLSKIQQEAGLKNKLSHKEKNYQARIMLFNTVENNDGLAATEVLIKYPNTINSRNYQWQTSLHICAEHKNTLIAQDLIRQGAKLDFKDLNGDTPLHDAFHLSNDNFAELLIEKDANYCIPNNDGDTALHLAIKSKNTYLIKEMLQNKSKLKINISDQEGNTPLMLAARDRNIDVVKLLLEAKAKTTLRNHNGESAYSIAISANDQKIADLISPHKKRKKFPTIDQEIHKQPMNKD